MRCPDRLRAPLLLFALFTVIGGLSFSYHYLDDLARGLTGTLPMRSMEEFTGVYSVMVLVPFIAWVVRRFGFNSSLRWPAALGAQFFGAITYTVAHTTLMLVSRAIIAPLAHMGTYDYGNMLFRYPMEASNDLLSFAMIAGVIYFLDSLERTRESELAAADLQRRLAEAQLDNLRLQLQPHFLFNTLNAISSVMYEDVGRADAMLAKLSAFLRAILASSDAKEVSLHDEIAIERMYVEIMTGRLENALSFDVVIDADAEDAAVPPMVLQPILENAIRHGMPPGRTALRISVHASRANGRVDLRVNDDGAGFSPNGRTDGRGLDNVRSRMAQLYDNAATFEIGTRDGGGTEAQLSFPYRIVAEKTA